MPTNDNVVNLHEYRPHLSGQVKCLHCGTTWVAVAPVGTIGLYCDVCGTNKGVFLNIALPETAWMCNCGNQLFAISDQGNAICANCGDYKALRELL